MYCHGASELEHNRFTQLNLSALSGLSFQIKSNVILFTSLLKSLGVFMTLQIKTSFESANILIIFILPTMERSLRDHMFNVFFKDPKVCVVSHIYIVINSKSSFI